MFAFKSGAFRYSNSGSTVIRSERYEDGLEKATNYCDTNITILDKKDQKTFWSMSTQERKKINLKGKIGGPFNAVQYKGAAYYTDNTVKTFSSTKTTISFACADTGRDETVYMLVGPQNQSPICTELSDQTTPGTPRIKRIAKLDSSRNCLKKKGWLMYADSGYDIIFVGKKGKKVCKKIQKTLLKNRMTTYNFIDFLRRKLRC